MNHKILLWLGSISLATLMAGCNSEIDFVKNSTLPGYEQTTIGRAVESVLGDVDWRYFETDKGVRVVEAKGLPGMQMFNFPATGKKLLYSDFDRVLKKHCENPQKVVIQFSLHANAESFDVNYCGYGEYSLSCSNLFSYMYRGSAKYNSTTEWCGRVLEEKAKKEAEESEKKRQEEERRKKLREETLSSIKYFTDPRNKEIYITAKIGNQRWMTENMKFATPLSLCYEGDEKNCSYYGRLYTWEEAKLACPNGWHLPSDNEFVTLIKTVGDRSMLKSQADTIDWRGADGSDKGGNNYFVFTMLPAGMKAGYWKGLHNAAYFWTSSGTARGAFAYENMESVDFSIGCYLSVRCVMDNNPQVEVPLEDSPYDPDEMYD